MVLNLGNHYRDPSTGEGMANGSLWLSIWIMLLKSWFSSRNWWLRSPKLLPNYWLVKCKSAIFFNHHPMRRMVASLEPIHGLRCLQQAYDLQRPSAGLLCQRDQPPAPSRGLSTHPGVVSCSSHSQRQQAACCAPVGTGQVLRHTYPTGSCHAHMCTACSRS